MNFLFVDSSLNLVTSFNLCVHTRVMIRPAEGFMCVFVLPFSFRILLTTFSPYKMIRHSVKTRALVPTGTICVVDVTILVFYG